MPKLIFICDYSFIYDLLHNYIKLVPVALYWLSLHKKRIYLDDYFILFVKLPRSYSHGDLGRSNAENVSVPENPLNIPHDPVVSEVKKGKALSEKLKEEAQVGNNLQLEVTSDCETETEDTFYTKLFKSLFDAYQQEGLSAYKPGGSEDLAKALRQGMILLELLPEEEFLTNPISRIVCDRMAEAAKQRFGVDLRHERIKNSNKDNQQSKDEFEEGEQSFKFEDIRGMELMNGLEKVEVEDISGMEIMNGLEKVEVEDISGMEIMNGLDKVEDKGVGVIISDIIDTDLEVGIELAGQLNTVFNSFLGSGFL
jgi:hypothetical protein